MKRTEFRKRAITSSIILDGATGSELIAKGMPRGVCPELWALENPDIIVAVQKEYIEAGSNLIYTPTFGGNRCKLEEFGLQDRLAEINTGLAKLARKAAGTALVFGDLAPTGRFVEPFGDMPFEEAVAVFKEQAQALLAGGVDGFVIETMLDIQEARAALIAIRELCDAPVMVSMTYDDSGRTLNGTDPVSALVTLQALGADAVGCNCSTGPRAMVAVIQAMKPLATVPLLAKPNAGLPRLKDGVTVFDMDAPEFASIVPDLVKAGVNILGGCCGTTPTHIAAAVDAVAALPVQAPLKNAVSAVSSARHTVCLGAGHPFTVVGERINPTGKKKLQAGLRAGKLDMVRQYAREQQKGGATILDVNMGLSGIDEKEMMLKALSLLAVTTNLPLCIDTTRPDVVEAALRLYPGRALVNSISGEKERIEKTLPLVKKYGAMFILLPLTDAGIPATVESRKEVVMQVLAAAQKLGYTVADIVLDGLVMTISSDQEAAKVTLDLIEWASREHHLATICGLSNVSFGMPNRGLINATFMSMAVSRGLTSVIANPSSSLLMDTASACGALNGTDHKLTGYVQRFAESAGRIAQAAQTVLAPGAQVSQAVLQGDEEGMSGYIRAALDTDIAPQVLVDEFLIPAITQVGDLFDKKEYFLPQLIMSADAMRVGFETLEPFLKKTGAGVVRGPKVLIATVQGDIHDIGKNIVGLMLKNYNFDVIDLGKDVSVAHIIRAAQEHHAHIIGLSALMTTTMVEMEQVVIAAREAGLKDIKFMIGGAVVDQKYAEEINADGYAADALAAVRLAKELSQS